MRSVLHKSLGTFATLTLLWCVPTFAALTVTIDKNTRYQTIEGMGAYNGIPTIYRKAGEFFYLPRPKDYEYDRMINDMGASGIRFDLPPQCFPEEGKSYNWNYYSPSLQDMREYLKRDSGIRFIVSVWSPPCWMKDTRSCYYGGHLEASRYDDMAKYIGDFLKMVKDSVGIEIYAISTQNEPRFPEPYNSCQYTEPQLLDLAQQTSAVLKSRNLNTKIFGAEDMFNQGPDKWTSFMNNNTIHAFAVHGYLEGGQTSSPGSSAQWKEFGDAVTPKKPFWMTETTTPLNDILGYGLNEVVHSALAYGNVSWWTWWSYSPQIISPSKKPGDLAPTSVDMTRQYYRFKNYSRFIRPGAVRIKCEADTSQMLASAFQNSDQSYSIVIYYKKWSTTQINITAPGLPTTGWKMYRTTTAQDTTGDRCSYIGEFPLNNPIPLIGKKETITLTTMADIPVLKADTTTAWVPAPPPSNTIGELNIHGDDSLELYVNNQLVSYDRTAKRAMVPLNEGQNIIACKLQNTEWGGGLISSMLLPGGDTLITDKNWKINYSKPADGWTQVGFDDSKWKQPTEMGPILIWPNAAGWGLSPINFHYQKAKWIIGATKTYFRKTYTNVTGPITASFYGNNTRIRMYVNGQPWVTTDSFVVTGEKTKPITMTLNQTGAVTIAIALEDAQANNPSATKRGDGVLFKMKLSSAGWEKPLFFDSTWNYSVDSVTNWIEPGFDDSQWLHPQQVGSYSTQLVDANYFYPTTFWFRKVFTSKASGVLNFNFSAPHDRSILKQEFYTLQGRVIDPSAMRTLKTGSVVLQRTFFKDNTNTMTRKVIMK